MNKVLFGSVLFAVQICSGETEPVCWKDCTEGYGTVCDENQQRRCQVDCDTKEWVGGAPQCFDKPTTTVPAPGNPNQGEPIKPLDAMGESEAGYVNPSVDTAQ